MNKAGTTIGQVQCRVGQFGHQLELKPAFSISFSTVGNRRKEQNSGILHFLFTPGPCLHMKSRVMNHKSATLVIQDLLKQTSKNGPLDIHSVKVRCFPCPHGPQFVTLKRTVHAKYCQRKGKMSSSSSVPLSTFLLGIFSRSKLR